MTIKTSQFLAIVFTALALAPGAAHLMELPAKIAMPQEPYFIVQQIYRGWAWAGIAIFAALFANLSSAALTRHQLRRFWLSTAAGVLIAVTLVIFFIWAYPANQVTGNWTSVPDDWEQLRSQWEYSHAANAMLTFFALLCSVGAAITPVSSGIEARRDASEPSDVGARRA